MTMAEPSTAQPGQQEQAHCKVASQILQITHRKWTGETGQIAERVDRRDPAAADAPVRKLAGSGQNIAGTADTPICAKQSNAITMMGLETSPEKPIPIAAMSSATAT
jgi:hypothetical protein